MYFLIFGLIIFFATHFYSTFRNREAGHDIKTKMGAGKYMGLYSIITIVGFALMIWGYGLSRPSSTIFSPPTWGRHVNLALMLPAFILLVSSNAPLGYLKQSLKHPMLLGVILWSAGHLLASGEMNSLILFGSFLAYSIIDRLAVSARPQPVKTASIMGDIIAIAVGTILYWVMIKYLHPMWVGVPVLA